MSEQKKINVRNRRATFDYEILEEFVAGVVLAGTEIKSIRAGKVSMVDSFCYFDKGELWVRGINIAEYAWGTCNNHVPRRDRKLLLNRRELDKLQRASQDRGLTIVGVAAVSERARPGEGGHRPGARPQVLRQARVPQGERCPPRDGPRLSQVIPCVGTDSYDDLPRPDFR